MRSASGSWSASTLAKNLFPKVLADSYVAGVTANYCCATALIELMTMRGHGCDEAGYKCNHSPKS